ncbi:hypothetical protein HGRIS_004390 [Hohenbuehelia grisea]|uniref:ABC transporter domain-containing protein n=1 Tax=Hohenbuehelia grisea TaxID=104357 RepID=A0ABR3JC30_9AGAR
MPSLLLLAPLLISAVAALNDTNDWRAPQSQLRTSLDLVPPGRGRCPPCFNCLLPAFTCGQFGNCDPYDGQCKCPPGWGGIDCLVPQCDSLADGEQRRLREDGKECECKEGWEGINCNVCKADAACIGFPLSGGIKELLGRSLQDDSDGSQEQEKNMTCYTGGETVFENHQMCDVTNRKIVDMLPDRPPQVTFSCTIPPSEDTDNFSSARSFNPLKRAPIQAPDEKRNGTCAFQFWTAQVESFYCALDHCDATREVAYDRNTTRYSCDKIKCKCVPGRFICGEDGSVDIGDFLTEEIKGPAQFSCISEAPSTNATSDTSQISCKFEEPAMNNLINDIFGDSFITLKCRGGECLHYSQVPGFVKPPKPDNTKWIALSAAGAGLIVVLASAIFWYAGRANVGSDFAHIRLPENEVAKLMSDHVPASLYFSNLTYTLSSATKDTHKATSSSDSGSSTPANPDPPSFSGPRKILDGISGCIHPGQVMAIMGASGAGKSTLLDILARRYKVGTTTGAILINGRMVPNAEFRSVTGYVDQEDTLMSTLTVYETVLYSALLRLPRDMSEEAKKFRVLETLEELGILGIKDQRVGASGQRSISGGEKRRVSIACELVTSPSILFLDEPTSGLDAYNAFNVVESLVNLARTYKRTVIFTIHQPRSNIVAMFDQLVLLAQGKLVYSGEFSKCQEYFEGIGCKCPSGFNIADYLIDLTMQANTVNTPNLSEVQIPSIIVPRAESSNLSDEEHGLNAPLIQREGSETAHSSRTPSLQPESKFSSLRRKTSKLLASAASSIRSGRGTELSPRPVAPKLQGLIDAFTASSIATAMKADGEEMHRSAVRATQDLIGGPGINDPSERRNVNASANANGNTNGNSVSTELPDVAVETSLLRGRKRASWATQFRILSGRAFKNLYRDPALLAAHYLSAIGLALICGLFFRNVTNDIAGFQNRLGIFFFTLALFGFSCLSSLGLFANERILFMRERANGYYSSFTYFSSKVLFDILPLRLVPPLVFGGIVYGLVGLVPTVAAFWKFMLTLVLFNLTTASVVLWLSIAFASISVASLTGTLVMLYNLLFTGLLINRETVSPFLQWLHTVSFFHAAFEALAVNELRYLTLKEHKYGVDLDVPAATILSTFGLRAQTFWWPNISLLGIFFVTFTTASFITLHFFVKEKR